MPDSMQFWLILMNILLGAALLMLILGILTGVLCDLVGRRKRRDDVERGLDDELRALFHERDSSKGRHRG